MKISQRAEAGAISKNDIHIILEPPVSEGIALELTSPSIRQFGQHIEGTIKATLLKMGIRDAKVTALDGGALDFTIRARVETAVERALGGK